MEYVIPIKCDKNNSSCTSSEKFILKDGKNDNNWVGHSVVKFVDADSFLRWKDIKEGGGKKNYGFDMDILEEVALEKGLNV